MPFLLFLRTIRQHVGFHLLIPLIVTISVWSSFELADAIWASHSLTWAPIQAQLTTQIPDLRHLILELISVYIAFLLVVAISVWESSDVRWTIVGVLEDLLPHADRYFAIGTIPLREWFEPNTQVYLDTILKHQIERRVEQLSHPDLPAFQHERVLLFQTGNDMRAVQASYLDEHYAKSFAAIHERFQIPLAYFEPHAVRTLLIETGGRIPQDLLHYPRFARPRRLWDKFNIAGIPRLRPFAVIDHGAKSTVMLFVKEGNRLSVNKVTDPDTEAACMTIVGLIRTKIYNESGQLRNEFNFNRFLRP